MILYFSKDIGKITLFPDLEHSSVQEVKDFLKNYEITPQVFHTKPVDEQHDCSQCFIVEQKPLTGSFVDLKNSLSVQLKVSS